VKFNPPDIYQMSCPSTGVTYQNILDSIQRYEKPHIKDVLCYIKGWFNLQKCARYKSHYFEQHFGQMECVGSGKPEVILVVAIKQGKEYSSAFGVHLLCECCFKRYIQQTKEKITKKSKDRLDTKSRTIYIYKVK